MATTYTGLRVQDTYNAIIKIGDNSNLTGTAKLLSDGLGNDSPLYLSSTRLGIGITPAYQFHTSGNAKIGGNLIISGNLTVNGTLTYLNVEDLAVEDPLIKLAKDNTSNTLDIGFFGKYVESATTKYTGLFWDASTDKFRLYEGLQVEPTTTVDVTGTGYTRSLLNADLEGNVTGTVSSLSNHDTNDLVEGTVNQYFTTARARASFTNGTGVTITNGEIAIGQAVSTTSNVTFGNITGSAISGTTGTFSGSIVVNGPTATFNPDADSQVVIKNAGTDAVAIFAGSGDSLYLGSNDTTGLYFDTSNNATFTGNVDIDGNLQVDGTIKDSSGDAGTSGQLLSSTSTGTNWIDFEAEVAKRIDVTVKNVSGGSLAKGVVVHAAPTATPPSGNVIEVIAADANVASSMPAIGVLNETIADQAEGEAVMFGAVSGIDTSGFSIGDELYVSETVGLLTATKPTAFGSQVQKIAVVIKSHASNGLIKVFGAGRANDVPNRVDRDMNFTDDSELTFGDSSDLKIYHTTNNIVRINSGDLIFNSFVDDGDIKFQLDNGSDPAGLTEYMRLDGGEQRIIYGKSPQIVDNLKLYFGNDTVNDASIKWDSTASQLFIGGQIKFLDDIYVIGKANLNDADIDDTLAFHVSSTDAARQRADARDDDTTYARLHWYGTSDDGTTSNFRHAYYDGANYINVTAASNILTYTGGATFGNTVTVAPDSGDGILVLQSTSQTLRIDQNSLRTTTNSQFTFMTNSLNALQLDTSQNSKFYGDLYIPENLIHTDDTDTYIKFRDNRQTLGAGGTEFIDFANTVQDYITIGGGSDIDIKLVSSTNNKYIFIQGSDGNIGINDQTPSYAFDVNAETRFGSAVNFDNSRYNKGGYPTYWYASTTNAKINWDARVEGTGVMIHKFNRNADDDAYLSYAENWYDGNSYHKISAYNDGFMLNGNIRFDSYGAGNITGTLSRLVGFTSIGELIDVPLSSFIDGSGVAGRIPYFTDSSSLTSSSLYYESSDKIRHLQTIGPNDDVRKGFCVEDQTAMAANVGGQLTFRYMYLASGGMTEGALIRMYKLNATDGDYSSGLKFQVRNTGDDLSTKMTLNPSGFLGLATTTPQKPLHIEGATGSQVLITGASDTIGDTAGLLLRAEAGESDSSLRAKGGIFFERTALFGKGKLHLAVNGSANNDAVTAANARLTIDEDGFVGIGLTSPVSPLHIQHTNLSAEPYSALTIKNTSTTGNYFTGVNVDAVGQSHYRYSLNGSVKWQTRVGNGGGVDRYDIYSWTAGYNTFTILNNGNVEIPSGSFTVSNGPVSITSSTPLLLTLNSTASNYGGILFKYAGAIKGLSYYNSGMMIFGGEAGIPTRLQANGQYGLTILTNLNVGIGNTNPSFKFQVYDTNVNGRAIQGTNVATSGTNYGFQGGAYGVGATKNIGANFTAEGATTNVGLIVNGDNNGALGINNISPDKTLTVGSTSQATSGIDIITSGGKLWEAEQYFSNEGYQGMYYAGTKTIQFRANDISYFNGGPVLINRTANVTTQPLQVEGFIDITKVDESALRIYNGSTFRGGFGMSTWGVGASVALTASDMVCYAVGNLDFVTNGTSSASVRVTNTGNLILTGGVHAFNGNYGGIAINVPSATKKYVGFYDSGTTNYGGGMWYDEASNITSLYSLLAGTETQHIQLDRGTGETWINPGGADVAIGHTSPAAKLDIYSASGDADFLLRTASQTLRFDQNSIRTSTSSNLAIFVNNNTANGFYLQAAGYVSCGTTSTPTRFEKFYTFGEARFESSVGPNMSVRGGLAHYDTTTGNGAGVGGQLVLGYRYSGNTYTEGAIIKMYKVNSTVGNYSSGLRFQVRNNGEDLSAKMTLNGGGDLSVVGSMTAAGDVIAFSDKRVKTNIKTINNGLEKISKLRGVSYNRTDIDDKSNKIGVIAQEVKEVLPEVVIYNEDDDKYGVEYGKMAGVFIEAIKELKDEVDSLKQEIKQLKSK